MRFIRIKALSIILYLSLLSFNAKSQLTTNGSETVANTTTSNNQQRPAIAMDANGNYIVVWESQDQDGDGYGIYAQIYDNTGTVQKSEFLVNTTTSNDQRFPDIAVDSDGDFAVVWQSYDQDGDNWGIYFQRFDNTYTAQGSETLVNVTITGRQCMPKIAMDDNGNFAIVWESDGEIHGATYNADGTSAVSEFQINSTSTNIQGYPDIAMDNDGDFVITWQSYDQDGDGFGIYHQRYNASAVTQGSETLVNTTTNNQQTSPSISIDDNGNYIIVWTDDAADGDGKGIFGQLYYADGTTNVSEFQVNTTTFGTQDNAQVIMTTGGAFSVVWNSYGQDGEYTGIYNQSYNTNGSTSGSETLVNTTINYFQQFPAITISSNLEAIIVWQDGQLNEINSLDSDGYGVIFQRYNATVLPVELLYFYAEKQNENVLLNWETATEINNNYFDVEWSINGIDFQKIGQVQGAGTSYSIHLYDFLHTSPAQGLNYYRLKQVDFDGKFEYSRVLNIDYQLKDIDYRIFPNPASDYITIENALADEVVQIFSSNGQLVKSIQIPNIQCQIPVHDLPKGTYFIKIGTTVKRIIIQYSKKNFKTNSTFHFRVVELSVSFNSSASSF